jgi:hypothetical protein
MLEVMGVLMGINMQTFTRPEGSDEPIPGLSRDTPPASSNPPTSPPTSNPATSTPASAPPPAEDVEMEDEEEAKAKKEAEAAKTAGNEAYKRRDFAEAAKSFEKAWELWPKDVTYLTNLGGESDSYRSE